MAKAREPILPRLLRSIQIHGECWIWTGSQTRDGYGVLTVGRKQYRAHRISYQEHIGAIPKGALVCHKCDTPLCINPSHLFIGGPKDNTRDMIEKGRRAIMRGSDHPNTKILPAQRQEIRRLRKRGMYLQKIADMYGVSFQCISAICNKVGNYAATYRY